jgi:phenylacetic acid degradation operon negative regulatory protein
MGIKDRRTQVLLTMQLLEDQHSNPIDLKSPKSKAFGLELNRKTESAIYQLEIDGCILRVKNELEDNADLHSLTDKGFTELCLRFPFFRFTKERWDNQFRILSYEIPEKKRELRDRLRREVSGWGLGPWHRSFWITPHPIIAPLRRLIEQKEEEKFVQAFESMHVFGNEEILIEKVWELKKLESQYKSLFKKWHEILSNASDNTLKMTQVFNSYVDVLNTDPGLPKELVGDKWIGFEAINIFHEIRDILTSKMA